MKKEPNLFENYTKLIDFRPACPMCGARDHKQYTYRGQYIFECPKCPEEKIYLFEDKTNKLPRGRQ